LGSSKITWPVRPARASAAAVPGAILRAGLERPPIFVVAVLHRDRGIVLLDAAAHLLEQSLDQRLVRLHRRFEIGVLGLQIVEHVLVIDLGIARSRSQCIGILDLTPWRSKLCGRCSARGGGAGRRFWSSSFLVWLVWASAGGGGKAAMIGSRRIARSSVARPGGSLALGAVERS
jgi:hypothetical protein